MDKLSVLSVNCHGYNIGMGSYLDRFRDTCDIILLHETWLSDCNVVKLDYLSDNYIIYHSSAMQDKIKTDFVSERPFGGTAVLIRKELSGHCYRIITDNQRITCVCLKRKGAPDIVIASVYMPWNDRTLEQIIEYEATVGCLQSLIDRHIGCLFLCGGDLNVTKHSGSVCSQFIDQFSQSNGLRWLESCSDSVNYTYHSDAAGHFSLLDYFLLSPALLDLCDGAQILVDGDNPSDHFAITCVVDVSGLIAEDYSKLTKPVKLQWDKGDTSWYSSVLSQYLSHLCLPTDALLCHGHCSEDHDHQQMLERYYQELIDCMNVAAGQCIPVLKPGVQKYWWTHELDELKQQCINATELWKQLGKPRS